MTTTKRGICVFRIIAGLCAIGFLAQLNGRAQTAVPVGGGSYASSIPSAYQYSGGFYSMTAQQVVNDYTNQHLAAAQTNIVSTTVEPGIQLAWFGENGRLYDVQRAEDLSAGDWTNLVTSMTGTGATNVFFDTDDANADHFYRVLEQP